MLLLYGVKPLFDFTGDSLQNVEINASQAKQSGVFKRAVSLNPNQQTIVVNQIDEYEGAIEKKPTTFLDFKPHQFVACKEIEAKYPMLVLGSYQDINDSSLLAGREGDQKYFQINKTGVAILQIHNNGSTNVPFTLKHYDYEMVSENIDAESDQLDVAVLSLDEAVEMREETDQRSGRVGLVDEFMMGEESNFRKAHLVAFSFFGEENATKHTISIDTADEKWMDYAIVSPIGEISVVPQGGGSASIDINATNGKWFLYALPVSDKRASTDETHTHFKTLSLVAANNQKSCKNIIVIQSG